MSVCAVLSLDRLLIRLLQGGAEPNTYPEPAGAPKVPRRIVPEAVGGANVGSGSAASAPAAAPKAPRRIVAEPVAGPAAPSSAAKSSLLAESAMSGKAEAGGGKAPKRITPTPLRTGEAISQQFGGAQQPVRAPCRVVL